jgi:hypothetical protein
LVVIGTAFENNMHFLKINKSIKRKRKIW